MGALGPLVAALLALQPRLTPELATEYADIVTHQARRRGLDPLLLVAFVTVESQWVADKVSPTYDFGLGQLHVSRHSLPQYRAREWVLFSPIRNLHELADLAAMWRSYHGRVCRGRHSRSHHWVSHLQWGRRVRGTEHAARVLAIVGWLRARVTGEPVS